MKIYSTRVEAIDPKTGEIHIYAGPNVPGVSFDDARHFCEMYGLGYCTVTHEFNGYKDEYHNKPYDFELIHLN